jgi:CPA2 family monovalent cation:H+ antiporter-2
MTLTGVRLVIMHPDIHLIEIAIVVLATLICGIIFERFKQPAVLGYILAGVILGPSCCSFISNREVVNSLAELGVLMLLFLIGMELSLRAFKSVWLVSLITTFGQLAVSFAVVSGVGKLFDLSTGLIIVLACSIALSSTAVAIKMLEGIDELRTETGRITVGVLIAQDLAIVPIILFLRGYETGSLDPGIFAKVAISIGLLAVLIWYLSRRQKLKLPFSKIVAGHHDLRPLAALIFCFGMAAISGMIGLSAAYGAFLGGLILGNTTERHAMIEATKPIQSVLMMAFFLSIGLLIDFNYIWQNITKVAILLFIITIGKTGFNVFILHVLRQPWERAFLAGLVLSQMGEFAFLLATLGSDLKLIDEDGHRLVLSLAALSLALSPLWMMAARRMHDAAPRHRESLRELLVLVYGPQLTFTRDALRFCKSVSNRVWRRIFKAKESSHNLPTVRSASEDDSRDA